MCVWLLLFVSLKIPRLPTIAECNEQSSSPSRIPKRPDAFSQSHWQISYLAVSGNVPQSRVVDVGRNDFLKASLPILFLDHVDEAIVDDRAVREKESASGAQLVKEEEILIL